MSFFLSFSVQNSFFHFYLLLARYEKRIKNRQNNKIVTFYYFLPLKQHDDETTKEKEL